MIGFDRPWIGYNRAIMLCCDFGHTGIYWIEGRVLLTSMSALMNELLFIRNVDTSFKRIFLRCFQI